MSTEEALRESAALGNLRAVEYYISQGVNVNSQNNVNGWTALHWACYRDHEEVARLLLKHGADAHLTTAKGERATDVAKGGARRVLGVAETDGQESEQQEVNADGGFVPAYRRQADQTMWCTPVDLEPTEMVEALDQETSQVHDVATPATKPPVAAPVRVPTMPSQKLRVFCQNAILGAILVQPTDTISKTITQLHYELELDIPLQRIAVWRNDGKYDVPVKRRQWDQMTLSHWAPSDAIVVGETL
ncbi:hypothetical protein BC832DRAFT_548566 [Gaertneriomyces semiglobifer]|nr:hypothetical protein BC832DRAFT_548566 [Gaertneriomyces semiglobifer]